MEKLNSDEKMTILMKLSANEIIKVCQTSKDLYRICGDTRYNPLWFAKIKKDFGINNSQNIENGYEEYKRLHILYKTKFYTVTIEQEQEPDEDSIEIFLTREDAEIYIHSSVSATYSEVETSLIYLHKFRSGDLTYWINEHFLTKKDSVYANSIMEEKIKYDGNYNHIEKLFEHMENKDEILQTFNDIMTDITYDIYEITENAKRIYIANTLPEKVNYFIKEHNLEMYQSNIMTYVKNIFNHF